MLLRIVLIIVGGFVALIVIGAMLPETPKSKDRAAIDLCWQDHERKSLDSGTKRFIAGTCEMMEQRFKERHGHAP